MSDRKITYWRLEVPVEFSENGKALPLIPQPMYHGLRVRCACGVARWTVRGYQEHYLMTHIVGVF